MSKRLCCALTTALVLVAPAVWAQSVEPFVQLRVDEDRPLRIALDRRVTVKDVGQAVAGVLVEAVYAYDRVVLPVGTKVLGRVAAIEGVSRSIHLRSVMGGDFTPPKRIRLQFDTLTLAGGQTFEIQTAAAEGEENVVRRAADAPSSKKVAAKVTGDVADEAKHAFAVIVAPDKGERLKLAAIRALPYHPQMLPKGTVYTARLTTPVDFGEVVPTPLATPDEKPKPGSLLWAQLVTPLDSATSTRGMPVEAILARPVFADDGALILPEGARLTGSVTFVRRARHLHRHGQLRFLFEQVHVTERSPEPLLASLQAVESGSGDSLRIDEEGGAMGTSSNTRFVAPALAALALMATTHGKWDHDAGAGPQVQSGGAGSSALGGAIGLGLIGIAINSLGHPVTVATTLFGLSKTTYSAVFGKGREVSFPRDTPMQLQLAGDPGADVSHPESRK
jgi:hypothetical protein